MKRSVILTVALLILGAYSGVCTADITLVNYYQDSEGVWHYEYTVSNPSSATDNIYDWMLLDVGPAYPETTPEGWERPGRSPYYGPGYIGWTANLGYEIAPGDSVSGFTIWGARPGEVKWETHGDSGSLEQGVVTGPIPEPQTLGLVLIGLVAVIGFGLVSRGAARQGRHEAGRSR